RRHRGAGQGRGRDPHRRHRRRPRARRRGLPGQLPLLRRPAPRRRGEDPDVRALILGGTGEARALAKRLVDAGWHVTSSLAGRVAEPKLPVGHVRIGGFGGPAGLTKWLLSDATEVIIDATHPFAERISASAAEAARATGLPLVALHRPAWEKERGDEWLEVLDMEAAAELARTRFAAPFLTIGR